MAISKQMRPLVRSNAVTRVDALLFFCGDGARLSGSRTSFCSKGERSLVMSDYCTACSAIALHGTSDAVYSVANAQEEIKLFVNSPDAKLQVVQNGQHFLSFSHPKEVDGALLDFVAKYKK